VDAEKLKLPTSTLKQLRSFHPDCNTFATPDHFKQKIASQISWEAFDDFGSMH
jgi:hypothetical protein